MESKKRERAANFNNAEVQLLVSLVDKHKQVIENKKTDAVTNKDKDAVWKKIETSFNSCGISTSIRTWKTLKLKYEGIKKVTKKKSSLQRQEMYRTGGGPSNAPDFNDVEEKVLSICTNITGLEARHDSDTIMIPITYDESVDATEMNCENQNDVENVNKIPDMDQSLTPKRNVEGNEFINDIMDHSVILEINKEEDNESQKENKWVNWHPKDLKTKMSNVIKIDKVSKASVTGRLDKLSAARLELVQLQIETTRQQHQFTEDEHRLKMLHLANDEARKQKIHELLVLQLKNNSSGPVLNDMV
ncbi:uncharacterized protein LOC135084378 [Ostrinia nubilalis]|uniref:uncharacterized protein LOC114350188 n=2 Tax=Ostrinia furnacalis TaxID=93504 RepID=UPI0010389426|nr:uncharacterized protein LOC114350188 [Ostrinia furnacalis]